jgi:hypothetical protein
MADGMGGKMGRLPQFWNTTPPEEVAPYAVDAVAPLDAKRYVRAVTVEADTAPVYRWLCQLRVAPYSYDWIDNRGRRSPRTLVPGLEDLAVGQAFCVIFRLVSFEPGRQVTAVMEPGPTRLFGDVALTYQVDRLDDRRSRLVCCMVVSGGSSLARLRRTLLGWGDLVMMRKQLLTLKACAESMEAASR